MPEAYVSLSGNGIQLSIPRVATLGYGVSPLRGKDFALKGLDIVATLGEKKGYV